jgi:VCBS repeat-containing protein
LGNVTNTPAADFNGADQFTYTVNDSAGKLSNTATVSVTINPVNDAPVANADAFETEVGVNLTIAAGGLLVNDTDIDGDALSVVALDTALTAGIATLNADGSISYTPSASAVASSTDSFAYTVSDGLLTSAATVTITLTAAPVVAPTANNDAAVTAEDTTTVINVLANDIAGSSAINPATVSIVAPSNGSAVADASGSVTYTPGANFNGVDQFSYTVTDTAGQVSNSALVSITVSAVNDAPVAVADNYGAQVGVTLTVSAAGGVLANDTDVENDPLSAGGLNIAGTSGTVSLNPNGSFTYTPSATAVAGDTDTFSYTANDGVSNSAPAIVTISIAPAPPAPPTANPDNLVTNEETAGVINVLANDTAGSAAINVASVAITAAPAHGSATVDALGNVTYTPTLNYFGPDQLSYTVNDSDVPARTSNVAVVSVTVNPVNDAPVGVADSYEIPFWSGVVVTPAASGVLFNDTDVEGDVLNATGLNTTGTAGTVVLYSDGSFAYTPRAGAQAGEVDSFTYMANDGAANSNVTTVTINIIQGTPVTNVLPEAQSDTIIYSRNANGNGPMSFNMSVLLANDTDPDDPNFPVGSTIVLVDANNDGIADTRLNGSSIVFNAATGVLTYTPIPGTSTRNDRFWYHVVDAKGGVSNEASVSVRVNP